MTEKEQEEAPGTGQRARGGEGAAGPGEDERATAQRSDNYVRAHMWNIF